MARPAPWHRLFYHGEVFGFVAAWVLVVLVAMSASQREEASRSPEGRDVVAKQPSVPRD